MMTNPLLQISPYEQDGGHLIGRDPRSIPPEGWQDRPFLTGLSAIRAKCLDCALDPGEVRKCVQRDCPLWPLIMGAVPKGYRMGAIRPKTSHNPSQQGWTVCRLHGAGGGAPPGKAHPNYKHGLRSKAFTAQRKRINQMIRDMNGR